MKWEYSDLVLHLAEKKGFVLKARNVIDGLNDESRSALKKHGAEGWELVSVLPYGQAVEPITVFLAIFKRAVE